MTNSRRKGRVAQTEARHLLQELDFEVSERPAGQPGDDFRATRDGKTYSVEAKGVKLIDLPKFERQARSNCDDLPWMVMARLPGYPGSFLITRKDEKPCVWRRG